MPFDRSRYPKDWEEIRSRILARDGNRCACTGECDDHEGARCNAPNGAFIVRHDELPAMWLTSEEVIGQLHQDGDAGIHGYEHNMPVKVVLTVAHLDHDKGTDESRLKALCQRCHLRLDRFQHASNAASTRRRKRTVGDLPGM